MAAWLESPYPEKASRFLRGNLHTHSTRSDGKLAPQDVINRYADLGYDFLALSDHDVVSDYSGLDDRGMVLLPANEVSGDSPHVLHLNARTRLTCTSTQQKLLDAMNADGGTVVLSHPNAEADFNHYSYDSLAALTGYIGIEIFNGGCLEYEGSHLATDKWDRLLSAGRRIWGFADDDAHAPYHIARGWNMVAAEEHSASAILNALRAGSFYASTGVVIDRIECDGPSLYLASSQAEQFAVIGSSGKRILISDSGELRFDASACKEPFIRVECVGRKGAQAWTQPFYIRDGFYDQQQKQLASGSALERSVLHALRSDTAPRLTGRVDDPLWRNAEVFDSFRGMHSGKPAPVKTQVRIIATSNTLYVSFICAEPEMDKLVIDPGKALWSTDSVEVFVDPEGRGMSCYQVGIGAGGALLSAVRGSKVGEALQVRGAVGRIETGSDRGWSAELAIPLPELQTASPGTRWGLHLCRNRQPVPGNHVWSWVGHSNHNRERYGSLIL